MVVVTSKEMRNLEQKVIKDLGISSLVLMENAGVAFVNELEKQYGSLLEKRVLILVGRGNNGGDGLVIARHLLNQGAKVKVYLLAGDKLSSECEHNLNIYKKLNGEIHTLEEKSLPKFKLTLSITDLVIDSLLGTGIRSSLSDFLVNVVDLVNKNNHSVISVDVPTGLDASTGKVYNHAIKADLTITFGFMKLGFVLYPGKSYCGKISVVDIGIPNCIIDNKLNRFLTTQEIMKELPVRPAWGHKGTFGHALVIAGSPNMAGAAYLASHSLLRSGAGMVTLAVPESIAVRFSPSEVMIIPIPDTSFGTFGSVSIESLLELLPGKDVLVLGPGITTNHEINDVVSKLLGNWKKPLVLDADGLNSLSSQLDILNNVPDTVKQNWVFTPHPGEMARLTGMDAKAVNQQRDKVAWNTYRKYGVNILLKGAPTILAGEEQIYINNSGNDGMGTAGMGDVLSGIIAGLICQGMEPFKASVLAAYIHGLSGDKGVVNKGKRGLIASDLIDVLPEILG